MRPGSGAETNQHCTDVFGRYAIYANNDFLRIDGSPEYLVAVDDALDKKLQVAGWEDHVAVGQFRICYARDVKPTMLTKRDRIKIVNTQFITIKKGAH